MVRRTPTPMPSIGVGDCAWLGEADAEAPCRFPAVWLSDGTLWESEPWPVLRWQRGLYVVGDVALCFVVYCLRCHTYHWTIPAREEDGSGDEMIVPCTVMFMVARR
jgi:hypothetical protein